MIRWLLRFFGYYKCDYGFATGRHWVSIDGKVIAQTSGDDVWMRDEDVHAMGYYILDHGKHWSQPNRKYGAVLVEGSDKGAK